MQNVGLVDRTAELQDLKSQREAIIKRQLDILEKINKLRVTRPTSEDLVVTFVKEIEKAHQYFEFKEYLKREPELMKHDSERFGVFKKVVKDKVHLDYDKLDFEDIMDAVQEGLYDLYLEEHPEIRESIQGKDEYAFRSPLTELVHEMKNNGYILKKNPLDEIQAIKNEDRLFYNQTFLWKLFRKNSAKKVVVRNIPIVFSEEKVKQLLMDCGEVESVSFESSEWCFNEEQVKQFQMDCGEVEPVSFASSEPCFKIAYATFKDSESAKIAPILMTRTCYTTLPYHERPEHEPDVPSSTEFRKALKKYEEFRELEGGNKKPKIDPSSTSDMQLG